MENLLAMPVRPLEVMLGKIVPYIFLGYVQVGLILAAAVGVFQVPVHGSVLLLLLGLGLFIAAQPGGGLHLLTLARNQLQAMQMAVSSSSPRSSLGLHVPLRRHAAVGASHRRDAPADPRAPAHPRHPPQGERCLDVLPHLWP